MPTESKWYLSNTLLEMIIEKSWFVLMDTLKIISKKFTKKISKKLWFLSKAIAEFLVIVNQNFFNNYFFNH